MVMARLWTRVRYDVLGKWARVPQNMVEYAYARVFPYSTVTFGQFIVSRTLPLNVFAMD